MSTVSSFDAVKAEVTAALENEKSDAAALEFEKISLKSADGSIFEVEKSVAMELGTVKGFLDDGTLIEEEIPLPNVLAETLSQVIAYCKKQVEFRAEKVPEEERKKYMADYVAAKTDEEMKELILAANYLNVKEFLDILCKAVAKRIKNKSVEYVRMYFAIDCDFTLEEEERLRQENAWAFGGIDED